MPPAQKETEDKTGLKPENLEKVKGYEMEEAIDGQGTISPLSKAQIAAIIFIIAGIVALIGRGLWKEMARSG